MILRWVLTITYLVVLAVAILVQFLDPAIAGLLFYGVLGWFVLSLFLYRLPAMNRPIGWSKPPAAPANGAPLPSGSPVVSLDFCTNCGTHVPPGTSVCPSCGRTIVPV
ncbi:MAG: zinc ribbon domain-containing protein [Thermoplasmata archaeon]|nr:zinc ribbon domain-containing protein [Thermoplasmata archaeon]MCI4333560.1 zinc ribbon domain-containing protein [Thermoplasmata archaeon]